MNIVQGSNRTESFENRRIHSSNLGLERRVNHYKIEEEKEKNIEKKDFEIKIMQNIHKKCDTVEIDRKL